MAGRAVGSHWQAQSERQGLTLIIEGVLYTSFPPGWPTNPVSMEGRTTSIRCSARPTASDEGRASMATQRRGACCRQHQAAAPLGRLGNLNPCAAHTTVGISFALVTDWI